MLKSAGVVSSLCSASKFKKVEAKFEPHVLLLVSARSKTYSKVEICENLITVSVSFGKKKRIFMMVKNCKQAYQTFSFFQTLAPFTTAVIISYFQRRYY